MENILCKGKESNLKIGICDFGSCKSAPIKVKSLSKPEQAKLKDFIESNCTLSYRSPEMVTLDKDITFESDSWMLGCIMYVLLFHKHPFEGTGLMAIVGASITYPSYS